MSGEPKQAEEAQAKPGVWTDRMLEALDKGVKGGKWFSLIDKVHAARTLQVAWEQVRKNGGSAGVDRETIERFRKEEMERLAQLGEQIRTGKYEPLAVRRVEIPKPGGGFRPLGIPAVQDRVVQTALKLVIEPIFEKDFYEHSYGFRPGRSAKDALRRVDKQLRMGGRYVVDADIKSFFDMLNHGRLMEKVEEKVADGRVIDLLNKFLKQGVMKDGHIAEPRAGTPQGGVISPLLANVYLHEFDLELGRHQLTRYADDFVIICQTKEEALAALRATEEWMKQADLQLHPEKTRIVDMEESNGFEFLGYRFKRARRGKLIRVPRKPSVKKYRDKIRERTKRTNGHSLSAVIASINQVAESWFNYFKHSHKSVFEALDGWTRMRLRSIMRKRHRGKGRGRGWDHQKWPNSFFAEQGLFTMTQAYATAIQAKMAH